MHVPSIALLIFPFGGLLSRVQLSVPVRLRRAILMSDVLLVKRIVKNNPRYLENPDFADRGNTSLHLAAIKGHADIVVSCTELGGGGGGMCGLFRAREEERELRHVSRHPTETSYRLWP
jgi:ankyrin repeat protein